MLSLLPDNPSARIEPVQGGGGSGTHTETKASWRSSPVSIPVSTSLKAPVKSSHLSLNRYKSIWKRTLGPSVPSRRKPRSDPYVVVGVLNVNECPTYIVAPFRGDQTAATDCIAWADKLLHEDAKAHVAFMGPIGSSLIEKYIETLSAKYPGHAFCVASKDDEPMYALLVTISSD